MRYVIIGNSAAAVGCIEGIRQLDKGGSVTVISSEPYHTYSRPLISYLLWGKTTEEGMKYRPDGFYEQNGCRALLGRAAVGIDPKKKQVTLDGGETLPYDKLLVAAGSRPFVPPMEGLDGVKNSFTFMSLDDARALGEALRPDSRVLVVGAGLIGLKCVEGIRDRVGEVTVADLAGRILPSVLELAGGWALYKLYHTRWWDYSDFPFNIGGYICLEFSLLWGVGTVVVMKAVHPVIAGFVAMVPQMVGFVLMCILYACYAADVVVTAFAASDLARELDALEKVADSMHAVSDAMTELLGTTAMDVDQKMDESRLQLKLAAAEARDNATKLSPRDAAAALRAKADEAMEAARKSSQEARLNASEAATAVKLAARGTAERTAELLRLEQLAEELQARSEEMRARTRSSKYFGKGRMLRAYPKLRHGEKHRSLDELRERLKYERRH